MTPPVAMRGMEPFQSGTNKMHIMALFKVPLLAVSASPQSDGDEDG
jgi:hypothetical protein